MGEPNSKELLGVVDFDEHVHLRALNRSPHPYHRGSHEILSNDYDRLAPPPTTTRHVPPSPTFPKDSTSVSDSGTEADDEHFLRGLPAPRVKLHKGLRGRNEVLSGTATPVSPSIIEEEQEPLLGKDTAAKVSASGSVLRSPLRRYRNVVRRLTEGGIMALLGAFVTSNSHVAPIYQKWNKDFKLFLALAATLTAVYPLRVLLWSYRKRSPRRWLPLTIPANFDPAPLLYPPAITILVSLLISVDNVTVLLPNLILGISALPQQLFPKLEHTAYYDTLQWAVTCLPLLWGKDHDSYLHQDSANLPMSVEAIVLLYPLHRTLCLLLHCLTTTSLLTAELQLLSIALIDILVLGKSPQMQILKALLWGGGVGVLVLCGAVIRWGIALARVPKWRFRRLPSSQKPPVWKSLLRLLSLRRLRAELRGLQPEDPAYSTSYSSEDEAENGPPFRPPTRVRTLGPMSTSLGAEPSTAVGTTEYDEDGIEGISRRHTLPILDQLARRANAHTPSGRRKRATSMSVRPFLKLTYEQATIRKWTYAAYVYACIVLLILVGIRTYVARYALSSQEPIGWALGYLFGDIPRDGQSGTMDMPPPNHVNTPDAAVAGLGWVEKLRLQHFGAATTRLLLSGYWLAILFAGLLVVLHLKDTYEVDTRRKVFHFMMVGMFLPALYVDPTYAALALGLILAIFLILDLLRASQLPPLSKPIASFLAPYVDGRDFRGPVVISHIFLLIGCAIPLWLALASIGRVGQGYVAGWEAPTRDASMLAGVICVGLGDAAASLIGRRYGHRKWLWGGGKSIEGSVAMAAAVCVGLALASAWLRAGGWPTADEPLGVLAAARNAGVCGSLASVTEAVLTGGNDNVIVPVVLWMCVKSLGV
ncbi:phosphatidate cytidylyltransferase, putative [Cordyceps militaris]|uniref:dolichol kinase n=1 Tax=Cordyceps militaris TaxID=73501 RepID=A0A2H4SG84_CORMI|nr:phosphatidate cytidylyltransferase, putative [Cordyceps militaris]